MAGKIVKCAPHCVQSMFSQLSPSQSLACRLAQTNSSDASARMTRQGILTPTRLLQWSMVWNKERQTDGEGARSQSDPARPRECPCSIVSKWEGSFSVQVQTHGLVLGSLFLPPFIIKSHTHTHNMESWKIQFWFSAFTVIIEKNSYFEILQGHDYL